MRKILLLSAYDAVSHKIWRRTLVSGLAEFEWTVLTLPPRHFSWRIRGNALSWSRHPVLDGDFDLIIATSMTDLTSLKGIKPNLAGIPAIVYFHENQFDYPRKRESSRLEAQMVTLYSAIAADKVVFNSSYNMNGFLRGAEGLLRQMPDCVPPDVVARIAERSEVLPVPVPDRFYAAGHKRAHCGPLTVLWNHRWEFDKGPDRLLLLAERIDRSGLDIRVSVTGQKFRRVPAAFDRIRQVLGDRILTWGYVGDEDYLDVLQSSHVVLSTAIHDFQGLAVLEAVAAGCVPLVPDRLAYPEWFAGPYRYRSSPEDGDGEALSALEKIVDYNDGLFDQEITAPEVRWLSWENLGPRYQQLMAL